MKFLVLGCVILIGLASLVAIAENTSENGVTEKPKMKEVHRLIYNDTDCWGYQQPFSDAFKTADVIFIGKLIENTEREKVTKRVNLKRKVISFYHSTEPVAVFEVDEILKNHKEFKDKTVHIDMDLPPSSDYLGEMFIVYASMQSEEGVTRFVAKGCTRSKPVSKLVASTGTEKSDFIKKRSGIIFHGNIKNIIPNPITVNLEEKIDSLPKIEFQVNEIFENYTGIPNKELKTINVILSKCGDISLLNQDYILYVNIHKKNKQTDTVRNNNRDFYADCNGMILIDEIGAIKSLVQKNN